MSERVRIFLVMSKKLTVLCDLDDVLFPLVPLWITEINKKYGTLVSPSGITDWDIVDFFPSLTRKQIFQPLNKASFWEKRLPTEDGLWFVDNVLDDGHELIVVTSAHYTDIEHSIRRLLQCYDRLSYSDIVITAKKQRVIGDVLIDDAIHNLIDGSYYPILKSMPHNTKCNEDEYGIRRVRNLYQAYNIVKNLAEGII